MLYRIFQYSVAAIWAAIVVVALIALVGMLLGQIFNDITGWWAIVPLVGEFTLFIGAGVWAFRSALRAFR